MFQCLRKFQRHTGGRGIHMNSHSHEQCAASQRNNNNNNNRCTIRCTLNSSNMV